MIYIKSLYISCSIELEPSLVVFANNDRNLFAFDIEFKKMKCQGITSMNTVVKMCPLDKWELLAAMSDGNLIIYDLALDKFFEVLKSNLLKG